MNEYIVGLTYADRLQFASTARHEAIRIWAGAREIAALTSLMGPMSDGPEWPAGAAWVAGRKDGACFVASDGLSDPWVERDRSENGLGLEIFLESPDSGIADDAPLTALADTWMFPMLAEISHTLASYPRLALKLLEGQLLSLEFNIDHIKDGRGRVGALLVPSADDAEWQVGGGKVVLIAAVLLTLPELRFLRGKGEQGRRVMLERLNAAGIGRISLLHRRSLV